MTKGTKIFRIIVCTLLSLTMLFSAFFAFVFCLAISKEAYGIYVAGVSITRSNKDDVLGDGTVYYDDNNNILIFDNATIESEDAIIYSSIDLNIQLAGENKFICTNEGYGMGIYAGDYHLAKDLSITGEGSLTIEIPNKGSEAVGIYASNLSVLSNVTVITSDCENQVNGIVCASSLILANKATVTVSSGKSTKYSSAVRVRGNALFEEGTKLNASVNPGTSGICKGLTINGDLYLGKDTALNVSIDDGATVLGECIRISGLMEIGIGSSVIASAKNAYAIECFGTIEANEGASISAASDKKDADVFCNGAVVNYGAEVTGEIYAMVGIRYCDSN